MDQCDGLKSQWSPKNKNRSSLEKDVSFEFIHLFILISWKQNKNVLHTSVVKKTVSFLWGDSTLYIFNDKNVTVCICRNILINLNFIKTISTFDSWVLMSPIWCNFLRIQLLFYFHIQIHSWNNNFRIYEIKSTPN